MSFFFLALSSCKDGRTTPPNVLISTPQDGATWAANSSFSVSGTATDELGLASLSLQLRNVNTSQVVSSSSITLDGLSENWSLTLDAGNRYTPAGEYVVEAVAYDNDGNYGKDQVYGTLTEFPLETLGAFAVGGNSRQLYRFDTANGWTGSPYTGIGSFGVDGKEQIVAIGQSATAFAGLYMSDFAQAFYRPRQGILSLALADHEWYTGWDYSPWLQIYSDDGVEAGQLTGFTRAVYHISGDDSVICMYSGNAIQQEFSASRLDLRFGGQLVGQVVPASDTLVCSGRKALLARDSQNDTELTVVDWESADVTLSMSGSFRAAAPDGQGGWVVATTDGVRKLSADGVASGLLIPFNYYSVAVDRVTGDIWCGAGNGIQIYSSTGVLVGSHPGPTGSVYGLKIWYNK